MKTTNIRYEKKFNTGNYENETISLEVELTEGETEEVVFDKLKDKVYKLHLRSEVLSKYLDIANNPDEHSYSEVLKAREELSKLKEVEF